MANQYYPTLEDFLDLALAELPRGLYAEDYADDDDPQKRSYSSAELRAFASLMSALSENLSTIDHDKFISTATPAGLTRWEQELFKDAQDSSLAPEVRRQSLLAKYRSSGGISLSAIYSIVASILGPAGLEFDLLPWSGQRQIDGRSGAWILGVSALGLDTYLSMKNPLLGNRDEGGLRPLDDDLDYQAAGLTQSELIAIQQTAYTYEVAIYGSASDQILATLDRQLTAYEPARSTHVIRNDAARPIDPSTPNSEKSYLSLPWRP